MKFKGVTPTFVCACKGNGVKCSDERARWASNGFWADVCQAHMDTWTAKLLAVLRNPWTGRIKQGGVKNGTTEG